MTSFPSLNAGRQLDSKRNKSPHPLKSSVAQIPAGSFKLAAGKTASGSRTSCGQRWWQIVLLLRKCLDKSTLRRLQRRPARRRKLWSQVPKYLLGHGRPQNARIPRFCFPLQHDPHLECLRSQVYGTCPQPFYSIYTTNVLTPCTVNDLLHILTRSLWRRLSQHIR